MTRTSLWLIALFALIAAACVAFGAYFSSITLLRAHREAVEARFTITAERLAATVELAASLGIGLPEQTTLAALLRREAGLEPAVTAIDVVDAHGVVLFSSAEARVGHAEQLQPRQEVSIAVRDDLGARVGQVVVRYDPRILAAGASALKSDLWAISLPTMVGAGLATVAIGGLLSMGLHRAARRAGEPERWPAAAQASLAALEARYAALAAPSAAPGGRPVADGPAGGPSGGAKRGGRRA